MGKSNCKITLTGYDDIIRDLERIGENVPECVAEALDEVEKASYEQYQDVIEKHRYSGLTEESLVHKKAEYDGVKVTLQTGFDIKKGGLAAIFLDRGTPKQKAVKYVRKIKNSKKVKEAMKNALENAWERGIR